MLPKKQIKGNCPHLTVDIMKVARGEGREEVRGDGWADTSCLKLKLNRNTAANVLCLVERKYTVFDSIVFKYQGITKIIWSFPGLTIKKFQPYRKISLCHHLFNEYYEKCRSTV